MRVIGTRKARPVSKNASGGLLKQGAAFNDELHKLPTGSTTFFPKGVYRYRTHEEANAHMNDCMIIGIVRNARR